MNAPIAATYRPGTEPQVVFIAQLGAAGHTWQPVIDLLTTDPATVTYDRPGIGASPPRPAPNPAVPYSVHADELAGLLNALTVTGPVVLVAHSVGSLIARVFAGRYPQRVAGMVHVDGSIPRLSLWLEGDGAGPDATTFDTIAGEVEVLTAAVPPVPTVVLTRTPGRWDVPLPHLGIDDLWSVSQRLLAEQLSAPLVVTADAGHQLPREAPALVAAAVDAVVTAVRTDTAVRLDSLVVGALRVTGIDR